MAMSTTRTIDPALRTAELHGDVFAEIRSDIVAARHSSDFHQALRLTAAAVRRLREHDLWSPQRVDSCWFDHWQTVIGDLGDLLDNELVPASELATDTDPLTGLGNRRTLHRRLADAVDAAGDATPTMSCAVAMIDLDRFKSVNDSQSHATGDAVLIAVAETLRAGLRTTYPGRDTLTRYGGDEFVAVLAASPLPVAVAALTRAVRAVAALPIAKAHGVTVSVGVATLGPGDEPAAVLRAADTAMYAVKRDGGNAVRCAPDTR